MNRPTDCVDRKIDMDLVLAALPPDKRRAVTLYMEGYTYREIAVTMGVSESAIKMTMARMRKTLRKII